MTSIRISAKAPNSAPDNRYARDLHGHEDRRKLSGRPVIASSAVRAPPATPPER
ncbi:hypothetical protein ACFFMN_05600 [Planobispora siamensis]